MLGRLDRYVVYLRWPTLALLLGLVIFVSRPLSAERSWLTNRVVIGIIAGLTATILPTLVMV